MKKLDKRQSKVESQMGANLFEDLLLEKSFDLDKFHEGKKVSKAQ